MDHSDGTLFHGPRATIDKPPRDLLRLYRTPFASWPHRVTNPTAAPVLARVDGGRLRVTTIGHASLVIQTSGHDILVDPVWPKQASPLAFAEPKRVVAPSRPIAALPPIDVVLITHNHHDHLDPATLVELQARDGCRVLVIIGNDATIRRHNEKVRVEPYD